MIKVYSKTVLIHNYALMLVASHAELLRRGSSRVPAPTNDVSGAETRDEPLRTSAWEAIVLVVLEITLSIFLSPKTDPQLR